MHGRIATLGSGVDGAVRRISTTYDVRDLVGAISSHDNAAGSPRPAWYSAGPVQRGTNWREFVAQPQTDA